MKLTKKRNVNKLVILGIPILLAAGVSYYIFALNGTIFGWQFNRTSPSSVNLQPPTEEQKRAGQQVKENTVKNDHGKPTNENAVPQDSLDKIVIGFSAINQNDRTLQIRTIIQEVLPGGTCDITLKNGNKMVTKSASIYPSASISTCEGFDIPVSELSPGSWDISINVISNNRNGSATSTTQID